MSHYGHWNPLTGEPNRYAASMRAFGRLQDMGAHVRVCGEEIGEQGPETCEPAPVKVVEIVSDAREEGTYSALGIGVLWSTLFYAVVLYLLWRSVGAEAMACAPLMMGGRKYVPMVMAPTCNPRARTFRLAGELQAECSEHGAPWVSFGNLHVDEGGNATPVDYEATCYLTSSEPLSRDFWWNDPDAIQVERALREAGQRIRIYKTTLPAYNAWWRAQEAGLSRDSYGYTWTIYPSKAEYLEGLD